MVNRLLQRHGDNPQVRIGIAPHSLRAVTAEMLKEAVAGLDEFDRTAPIHIHIAEQVKEVEDCRAWSNQRPVEWLLNHQPLGPRWCLVHATHMTEGETGRLARTGAAVGLCPTTEGNLGDGFFQAPEFLRNGGVFGIGSDSHISVSPVEELRWLDKWVRDHTTNRYGPVREVEQKLVLEIAFDGIARSTRHKSGVAMRFPRINRIRTDKPAVEADTVDNLLRLVP